MRGHEPLLRMRRAGFAPFLVNLETDGPAIKFGRLFPAVSGDCATLQIEPHEALHRADLRCLKSLVVVVGGCDSERVQAVCEACVAAGAERVIGNTHCRERDFRAVRVTDTDGVFSWQE